MRSPHDRERAVEALLRRAVRGAAPPEATSACLDAETLAAWVDGGLDPPAVSAIEAHASSCARCMSLASSIMETIEAERASAPEPANWHRWLNLRWLVPLTAGATAVALWAVVPSQPRQAPAELADAQKQVASEAAAPSSALPGPPAAREAAPLPSAPAAEAPRAVQPEEKRERTSQTPARNQAAADAPAVPPGLERRLEDAPRQARRDELAKSRDTSTRAKDAEGAPAALPEAVGFAPAATAEIATPDPAVRWRIAGTRIEQTTDAGVTWTVQRTEAGMDLIGGSAPSATICWMAGRGGLVLRTVDGRTWTRVAFPEAVDLTRVQATSALAATVTTADGRVFRTTDGGTTWAR